MITPQQTLVLNNMSVFGIFVGDFLNCRGSYLCSWQKHPSGVFVQSFFVLLISLSGTSFLLGLFVCHKQLTLSMPTKEGFSTGQDRSWKFHQPETTVWKLCKTARLWGVWFQTLIVSRRRNMKIFPHFLDSWHTVEEFLWRQTLRPMFVSLAWHS